MQGLSQSNSLFALDKEAEIQFREFERKILELAQQVQVDLAAYTIDHVALRVNSEESAKIWLMKLLKCGKILSDNVVNGRKIYLIELFIPLTFANQQIHIIELPFPKDKTYPQESWEHIEIVLPFLEKETIPCWINRVKQLFLLGNNPILKLKISEPKVEGEQLPNPSIAISFCDQTQNHTCIKIHPYHIKNIIHV
ncbi:VOC family protein [[Haemophilus] felis]|uniref:Metalloprotein n=1 Tax=[Haemophilus] felis TaxID=123822 RepID=A0A1T0AWN4_9PAST|nr:VOC family protein [[Haemophilus] felis]NBI41583.1 VOC family protein [[Haemophilus] felis]NBI42126.1 VOC family protein [[Haemophilus] felis]OOS02221.1 metalloprotein [[Haemophilus] felis]